MLLLKNLKYITLSLLILSACTSNIDKAAKIETRKKELIDSLFLSVKDWKNSHEQIDSLLARYERLDNNVSIYEYNEDYLVKIKGDSLSFLSQFETAANNATFLLSKSGEAKFWRDSINGFLLLDYTLYPNPKQSGSFIFTIEKRNQE